MVTRQLGPETGFERWDDSKSGLLKEARKPLSQKFVSASPASPYPWTGYMCQEVAKILKPFKEYVDSAFAYPKGNYIHVYILTNNSEYNHDLAKAMGLLEVILDEALRKQYEEVCVYPTPVWSLTDEEKSGLTQGGVELLK
jgi:hypothetical protein